MYLIDDEVLAAKFKPLAAAGVQLVHAKLGGDDRLFMLLRQLGVPLLSNVVLRCVLNFH